MKKRICLVCSIFLICVMGIIGLAGAKDFYELENSNNDTQATKMLSEMPHVYQEELETSIESAENYLRNAFSFEAEEITPEIEESENSTTIFYGMSDTNVYVVEFHDDGEYPSTLYHFCHMNADEGFDLAKESDDYFKDEMIERAKNFLNDVYGIDSTEAEVHAYGYGHKIAVQIEVAPDQIFQVKFYYDELDPVGVQFSQDVKAFERAMQIHQAKCYF